MYFQNDEDINTLLVPYLGYLINVNKNSCSMTAFKNL